MIKKLKGPLTLLFTLVILLLFYIILYHIYSPRVSAFGCFDDCFNYVAGYFLLKGKTLYSEIFFNHQPLMAYLSHLIQLFTQPINIYQLVLRHRQFIFLFSFLMNGLIAFRFGLAGLGFAFFYELTKFYLFGDRFLAEGLIIYPLVYLTGLVWHKFNQRKIYPFEYILAAFFVWLVIFMRAPFIPLALFLYILILWGKPLDKRKKISLGIFTSLVLIILVITPLSEYFFNLVTVNTRTGRFISFGILQSFFYPLLLFFGGKAHIFNHFLLGLNSIFLVFFFWFFLFDKKRKLMAIIFFLLGLTNLMVIKPGTIFYEAFHLLPWYGLLVFIIFLMLIEIFRFKKRIGFLFFSFLVFLFFSFLFSLQYFAREKINPHEEFLTNFSNDLQMGEAVKSLSDSTDTLFLDGFDDLIYWQADRLSPYPYSWYTSVMPHITKYSQARLEMFANNPPDFYYGTCPDKEVEFWTMPGNIRKDYQQLYSEGKPTCLYVRKEKISHISKESWKKAKELLYELPE